MTISFEERSFKGERNGLPKREQTPRRDYGSAECTTSRRMPGASQSFPQKPQPAGRRGSRAGGGGVIRKRRPETHSTALLRFIRADRQRHGASPSAQRSSRECQIGVGSRTRNAPSRLGTAFGSTQGQQVAPNPPESARGNLAQPCGLVSAPREPATALGSTLNPKVGGSIPARPIGEPKSGQLRWP